MANFTPKDIYSKSYKHVNKVVKNISFWCDTCHQPLNLFTVSLGSKPINI